MADLTPAHELRAHATRTDMPSSCLRVYLALLDHRGDNATAWPSVARLAERSGCRERTVQDALGALRRHGWIVLVDNQRRTAEYELHAGTEITRLIASREPRAAYLERVSKPRPADPSDRTEGASLRTPGCEPSHPSTPVLGGASRRTRGCEASHPGVRAVAPGGCEPSHPNSSVEPFSELFPPVVPPAGDLEPEQAQPQPAQPDLLSPTANPAASPKPKQGKRPGPKPKPDPEQDPTWSAFAALAVETGLVDAPPKPDARAPSRKVSRATVIAEYVAEHGAERVLAVWRWVLTSPGRSATWWREARVGGELVGSFLRPSNFEQMADSFDGERKHGVKLEVVRGGRGTFGQLPAIEESEYRHEQALAWRELAPTPNPPEEEIDDALCW